MYPGSIGTGGEPVEVVPLADNNLEFEVTDIYR